MNTFTLSLAVFAQLLFWTVSTDMRRLTTGIRYEKYVVRWFQQCANVIECTYTNLDSIAYYTIDSLRNPDNHAYLIEEIRRRVAKMQGANWKIEFSWVKAHTGIHGNELAEKPAKEAARNEHTDVAFCRIPISTLYQEIQQESIQRWQKE